MEPKFVSIDQVVAEYKSRPPQDWQSQIRKAAEFFGNHIMPEAREVVITEDIDCEVIEPKQLPAP